MIASNIPFDCVLPYKLEPVCPFPLTSNAPEFALSLVPDNFIVHSRQAWHKSLDRSLCISMHVTDLSRVEMKLTLGKSFDSVALIQNLNSRTTRTITKNQQLHKLLTKLDIFRPAAFFLVLPVIEILSDSVTCPAALSHCEPCHASLVWGLHCKYKNLEKWPKNLSIIPLKVL